MRIAHIGNIASNAYLSAKFQRRLGIEADSFDLGGGNPMWLPWWEEADLDPTQVMPAYYDWVTVADAVGVRRPSWAKILGADIAAPWYDTQEAYQADLARMLPTALQMEDGYALQEERVAPLREALAASPLSADEQAVCVPPLAGLPAWRSILALSRAYDLLVFYGPHASYGCVLPKGTPYVTFEHSTMRLVPLLDQPEYHSLAAAYRHAGANIITNADCGESAWQLGLDNCTFIPHPLDDERFSPLPPGAADPDVAMLQENLHAGVPGDFEVLLFAPARQSRQARTGAKRNDRIFAALKRYIEEAEPQGAPRAALVAGAWGTGPDVQMSEAYIRRLGLAGRVIWLRAQPKRRMVSLYRAADIVLDQFSEQVGSFGTVTAEAMACGKPVITYVNPDAHQWCLDALGGQLPPICQARTADDIYEQLVRLTDPAHGLERRQKAGQRARAWVDRVHGWRVTTERSLALYARVLGVTRDALVTQPVGERLELPAAPAEAALSAAEAGELVAAG